jgi:tetratricopeptide (TPR) repeat protein
MRRNLLAFTAVAVCLAAPAVADATRDAAVLAALDAAQVCGPGGSAISDDPVASMVMVDGFGKATWNVGATPEAQAWFDHGVRLRWAFEHKESVRAFRKARLLDPSCAMCAWGEAWALGPNLNGGGGDDEAQAAALKAAREARRLARNSPATHKRMIDALVQRYSGRTATRARRFARAMDNLATRNPDDLLIVSTTADAWLLTDYDWWNKDGTPKAAGVARAMGLLEHALQVDADDPGAIHLYIHLTEWSDDPHRAVPYGEKLARLAPGASHLVHMPSHTFYRVGRYRDAMNSNVEAVALDRRYDRLARPDGGVKGMPLHSHNIHFGMGGALMGGGAERGLELADWFLATYDDIGPSAVWRAIQANNAYALYGRFADAQKIASIPEPAADKYLLRISWRYMRGEAAARAGDAAAVRAEAEAIRSIIAATTFIGPMQDNQKGFVQLGQHVLEGRAAMIEGDHDAAVAAFMAAAAIQAQGDGEGGDPPIIWYPTRRSLAAALLARGDAAGAKAKIEELLKDWPNDPYSYFVLAEAEEKLGNARAAADAREKARAEWVGGTMSLALA